MCVIAIKATNYHCLNLLLPPMVLLILFLVMFVLPHSTLMMAINIMLFLSTIILNMYGSTLYRKNLTPNQFFFNLKPWWKNTSRDPLLLFTPIMVANMKNLIPFLLLMASLASPLHPIRLNIMAIPKGATISSLKRGLSFLFHTSMPLKYWTLPLSTVVYLINRMPTPTLSLQSPFSKLFGSNPNYDKLRSFGCLCYPWLRTYISHKLDPRSKSCIFVGYYLTQSAYYYLDSTSNTIYVSRHVKFVENSFPFAQYKDSSPPPTSPDIAAWCDVSLPLLTPFPIPPTAAAAIPVAMPSSNQPPSPPTSPNSPPPPPPSRSIVTRSQNNIVKPNPKYKANSHISNTSLEPTTVARALKSPT